MASPLSNVSLDDEVSVQALSLSDLTRRAPSHEPSRQILTHIIGNQSSVRQTPRPLATQEHVEDLSLISDRRCQLHWLCEDCAGVFGSSKLVCGSLLPITARSEKYTLHRESRLLRAAAGSGCHFCTLLLETPQESPPTPKDAVYAGTKFDTATSPGWFHAPNTRNQPHAAQAYTFTGSSQHMSLAKYWMSECVEKHRECRRERTRKLVAARYIHIKEGENGQLELQLHITSDEDHELQYCALSHCWGGATDFLILKSSNIEDLRGRIDGDILAKSFQNAVTLTHALGMKYLWIDCLCIIQDSEEDWLRESARMGHIYEGATCTIMAAAAKDPHGGLFQTRSPLTYSPCRIAGSSGDELFVLPHGHEGHIAEVVREAPLQSRAWTFQESYLSPRKLYLGPNGIYWSCFTGQATERDPNGKARDRTDPPKATEIATIFGPSHVETLKAPVIPPLMLDNGLVLSVTRGATPKGPYIPSGNERVITGNVSMQHGKPPRRKPSIVDNIQFWAEEKSQEHESLADFHAEWFDVVSAYSGRSLTKASDKLVAISGIASRIKHDCGYEYIAGLWKETILLDLLWHVNPHTNAAPLEPRTAKYIAPSWSWASVEGRVTSSFLQPDLASVPLADVESVTVSTGKFDEDATGPVSDGVLTLIGRLRQVSDIRFGRGDDDDVGTSHRRADAYHAERKMGWIDYDVDPTLSDLPTFVVPIVEDMDWSFSHYPRIHGIAMIYHETHFERVGVFLACSHSKPADQEEYEWFVEGDYNEFEIR